MSKTLQLRQLNELTCCSMSSGSYYDWYISSEVLVLQVEFLKVYSLQYFLNKKHVCMHTLLDHLQIVANMATALLPWK